MFERHGHSRSHMLSNKLECSVLVWMAGEWGQGPRPRAQPKPTKQETNDSVDGRS